jgi:hypothetical protein
MQIHEINQPVKLAEGFFSNIGNAVTQSKQQRQVSSVTDKAFRAWDKYAQNLKANTPDPARYEQLYRQTLESFVQKNLLGGNRIEYAINQQEIDQLINNITAARDDNNQVARLFSQLVQQSALSQQQARSRSSTTTAAATNAKSQVTVINKDPALVQFKNVNYVINDQGEWIGLNNSRVVPQSFQQFLDDELNKALGTP